jgi:hypothetical protein
MTSNQSSDDVLARADAAAAAMADTEPRDRARALVTVAEALDAAGDVPQQRSPAGLSTQWGSLTGTY